MSGPDIQPFKYAEWTPPPPEYGFVNVVGKVILDSPELVLALLRFGERASVPEHPGETHAIVSCLEGEGFVSVGGVAAPFRAGERVGWPPGVPHALWTEASTMTTLMVERPAS
jgi:quercetin dioxygenase-like cupin family protein